MLFYLDAVARLHAPSQSSLFIPHSEHAVHNITPQAVSRYVIHVIRWAYDVAGKASPDCRAHDVRKIAASLRALSGDSLQDVLTSGQLSSPYTFLKHYFLSLDPPQTSMCRRTLYVFFLFAGFKTGKVNIVVGDNHPLVGVEAAADEDVRFRLPTDQRSALPDAPIKAFLTRNIRPGEEEPAVLRLADFWRSAPSFTRTLFRSFSTTSSAHSSNLASGCCASVITHL